MATIGQKLEQAAGTGPGFNFLRFGLALFILFGHTRWIANGVPVTESAQSTGTAVSGAPLFYDWMYPRHAALVPMFFVLSGFLVMGSAIRTRNVGKFLYFRGLRICPALAVEVTLSAILLGPALTTWKLEDYFSDPRFFWYFGNIVGRIRFTLPGLFENSPAPNWVNINLWTLAGEFYCYFVAAVAMVTGLLYSRRYLTIVFGILTVCLITLNSVFDVVLQQVPNPTSPYSFVLVYYFFAGALVFLWRDRIPLSLSLFAAAVLASYALFLCSRTIFIAPIFLTYVTVFIGMSDLPKLPFPSTGDYSYGVYLYGFPLTQALITIHPGFRGHSWELLLFSVFVTLMFAVLSWHLIEKHFLKLKFLVRIKQREVVTANQA